MVNKGKGRTERERANQPYVTKGRRGERAGEAEKEVEWPQHTVLLLTYARMR